MSRELSYLMKRVEAKSEQARKCSPPFYFLSMPLEFFPFLGRRFSLFLLGAGLLENLDSKNKGSWERETFPPSFINSVHRSRGEVDFPAIFTSEHEININIK